MRRFAKPDGLDFMDEQVPSASWVRFKRLQRWFTVAYFHALVRQEIRAAVDRHGREVYWTWGTEFHRASLLAYATAPWVVRVAINTTAVVFPVSQRVKAETGYASDCDSMNRRWQFELSCLPHELEQFPEWLAELAVGGGGIDIPGVPPVPCHIKPSGQQVWTEAAEERFCDAGVAQAEKTRNRTRNAIRRKIIRDALHHKLEGL